MLATSCILKHILYLHNSQQHVLCSCFGCKAGYLLSSILVPYFTWLVVLAAIPSSFQRDNSSKADALTSFLRNACARCACPNEYRVKIVTPNTQSSGMWPLYAMQCSKRSPRMFHVTPRWPVSLGRMTGAKSDPRPLAFHACRHGLSLALVSCFHYQNSNGPL